MKIGFNFGAITKNDTFKISSSTKDYCKMIKKCIIDENFKKIIDSVEKDNHEIFVFAPTPLEFDDKLKIKIKKRLIKKLETAGMDISKVALVSDDDLVNAYRRNHIDIAIETDQNKIDDIKNTEAIYYDDTKVIDILLNDIFENIDKSRQPSVPRIEPQGMPSQDKLYLSDYSIGDIRWADEEMSPYDRLVSSNFDWKDEIAMEYFGRKYTHDDFIKHIDMVANGLAAKGIKKGMKVPALFVNTPESLFTFYALMKLKVTFVPLSPLIKPSLSLVDLKPKLDEVIKYNKENGFDNTYIFISDILCERLRSGFSEDINVVSLDVTDSMPWYMKLPFKALARFKMGIKPVKYSDKTSSFKKFVDPNAEELDIDTSFDNSYAAVQLYTGGTIKPKAVKLSEGSIDAATRQFSNDRFDFKRGDKMAAFMPLNHSFGLIIGTHVAATLGVNLDLIMKIDFKKIHKYFLKDRVNIFGGIPTMFPAIRESKELQDADLSNVKYILSGGSKLDPSERQKNKEFFESHNSNAEVKDGYGQTEAAGGFMFDGIPNIGLDAMLVEPGTTNEVGYETVGELCVAGKQVMLGYEEDELNEGVLVTHPDGKVWLHTGDGFVIHKDGKFEYIDRLDRMIKINGEQVVLSDLEEVINKLPFVQKSVVVKRTDSVRGFATVAYIKLEEGYTWNEEIANAINELYVSKFPKYAIPKTTDVLDKFPVTAVGKVDFKVLEKMAVEKIEEVKIR